MQIRCSRVGVLYLSAVSISLVLLFAGDSQAQEPISQPAEIADREQVREWVTNVVGNLKLSNNSTGRQLIQKDKSLLRWSNPIAGNFHGDSYLWTEQGRPAAFLSIYARFDGPVTARRLTFQSLSLDPLTARLNGVPVWHPTEPGVEFNELTDVPPPSPKSSLRRLQMSRIARQFRGRIQEEGEADRFRELRLLTSPLYHYESQANNVDGGSLFAFADSTDPELLLLVESRVEGETRSWHYAAIRQNHRGLKLSRGDEAAWEVPAIAPPFGGPKISDPNGVYYNVPWSVISGNE